MEVFICLIIALLLWFFILTFLLPLTLLLMVSERIRARWFSFLFVRIIIRIFNRLILPLRRETLDLLKADLKNPSKPLEILEIGIGAGSNLPYYPANSVLHALDVNGAFETYLKENQRKYPQVTFKRMIYSGAEDMREVEDNSMDVVISTYVLCSVQNVKQVLSEIKRVLKPGGRYLFMEHVAYRKSEWSYLVQKFVAPIVRLYGNGCNIDRHNGDIIRRAGFSDVNMSTKYRRTMIFYFRPHLMGIATK